MECQLFKPIYRVFPSIAFLLSGTLAFAVADPGQADISLIELPSPTEFTSTHTVFDNSTPLEHIHIVHHSNARLEVTNGVKVMIDGVETQVAAWQSSVLDKKNPKERFTRVDVAIDSPVVPPGAVLAIELAAASWVQGGWGPLKMALVSKDGTRYGQPFDERFGNRGRLLKTCFVELKDKDGNAYTGNGDDLTTLSLSFNGTQTTNTLYIKRIFTGLRKERTKRSLQASFLTAPSRLKVYPFGQTVDVKIMGDNSEALSDDTLLWSLENYKEETVDKGEIPFTKQAWSNGVILSVDGKKYPAGYYALHLELKQDGATLPWKGTRPAGYVAFGWLPKIDALPLQYADESRFGAQGTNGLKGRDPYNPLYTTLGLRWVYRYAKLAGFDRPDHPFVPKTDEELQGRLRSSETLNALAYIQDAHSVPARMLKLPQDVNPADVAKDMTRVGQRYELSDPSEYIKLFKKVADQANRLRKIASPHLSRNYYQIHWEPDWHYRGSDEDFIVYYKSAREALSEADPSGFLLGANYAVIDTGNVKLERLFRLGLGQYLDGVVTHLYYMKGGDPEDVGVDRECRKLRQLTDRYIGPGAPIFQTEWGSQYPGPILMAQKPGVLKAHMVKVLRGHLIALGEGIDCTWFFYTADHGGMTEERRDQGRAGYGLFFNQDPEGNAFGAREVAPKPLAMAVATATRLLEGTKTLGRLDYLSSGVYAYAFQRGDRYLYALWAPHDSKSIRLEVKSPVVTVYDVMGNAQDVVSENGRIPLTLDSVPCYVLGVAPEAVPNANSNRVLAAISGNALGKRFLLPGANTVALERDGRVFPLRDDLRIDETLSAGIYCLTERDQNGNLIGTRLCDLQGAGSIERVADDQDGFHVSCLNRSEQPQSFSLAVTCENEPRTLEMIDLEPLQRKDVVVPFEKLGYASTQGVPTWIFSLVNTRNQATNALVSRGWSGMTPAQCGSFTPYYAEDAVVRGKDRWKGSEDFSVRYRVDVEPDSLRLVVEAKDNVTCGANSSQSLWEGDSVMVVVGSGSSPDASGEWSTTHLFGIFQDDKGRGIVGELMGSPPDAVRPVEGLNGKVVRDDAQQSTRYELDIPLRLIGDPEETRREGRIGFGFSVQDADTPKDIDDKCSRQMRFLGGVPAFMENMKFGTLYLGRPE